MDIEQHEIDLREDPRPAVAAERPTVAWAAYYKLGLSAPAGTPLAYGILCVKEELGRCGYNAPQMKMDLPTCGNYFDSNLRAFQADSGLAQDGEGGPETLLALLRPLKQAAEQARGIPNHDLARMTTWESLNDPAAVGSVDPNDHGADQINLKAHPTVTLAQAHRAGFSVPWAGSYLETAFASIGDRDAALASYNVGYAAAKKWLAAGKPSSGYVVTLSNGKKVDLFTQATYYVFRVRTTRY